MEIEALQLVDYLNQEAWIDGIAEEVSLFEFRSVGSWWGISFMGEIVWHSDDDERPYINLEEEREDLKKFVLRKSRVLTDQILQKLNNIQ